MARQRSPNREKAFELFKEHSGNITNRRIAELLDVPEKTIGGWKVKDKWNEQLNGVLQINERSTPKRGAPKENKNAVGNSGGAAPKGNSNAVTHGFFRRIFPDDEETLAIVDEIGTKSPIDMIWENIVIQYAAIARAQKIMFVESKEEMIKELKKRKYEIVPKEDGGFEQMTTEEEYEFQFAWDRHATFLNAQSRAISTLQSLIKQFDEMAHIDDERRLKLEQMRLGIKKTEAETDFAQMRAAKLRGDKKDTSMLNVLIEGRKQYEQMMNGRENDE
ncbi:phage terminase small subunit [Bacillus sp. OTU530]|uniref:phage terminase small subunit n=1 Tax=Bacillus sp. OTU530 TaxID=3043862 RepID=UPI00313E0FBE